MSGYGLAWTVTVQVDAHREGSVWVANCPALDVASHGDSKQDSYQMLEEALAAFFEDCCEHDTLLDVLAEKGLAPTASMVSMKPPPSRKARLGYHNALPRGRGAVALIENEARPKLIAVSLS